MTAYSERIVQRVNELYHDIASKEYQSHRPEIFEHERQRWDHVAKRFLLTGKSLVAVDIGTGTGFVPLTIGHFLKNLM